MIRIQCPCCPRRFDVADQAAGMFVACPDCRIQIEVPKAQPNVVPLVGLPLEVELVPTSPLRNSRPIVGICAGVLLVLAISIYFLLGRGDQKSYFDKALVVKYNLKGEDFNLLQYYLAADLNLTRQVLREDTRERVKGKLVQRQGEVIEEVVVKKGTPGVCIGVGRSHGGDGDWLMISFEEGTYFEFGPDNSAPHRYHVHMRKLDNDEVDVLFMGNVYRAKSIEVLNAALQVSEESLKKAERQRKTLGGRKLKQ